ncbi:MAG: tetratricopeptide repeat protein [Polyangiaceae bacterium]
MRRAASLCLSLSVVLGMVSSASAAPETKPSAKPEGISKASAERTIEGPAKKKPVNLGTSQGSGSSGPGSKPSSRGPRIPEALRKQLEARLEGRIDRDLAKIKGLREEAIGLLTTFIAETPKSTREMPEALLRLGELKWELERESFVTRFQAWEKKPAESRGSPPEPNYTVPRELFGRVLRDYPWFPQYDLALYVDGFMAAEQGKSDEAFDRFSRILREYPKSRFVPDAHMAKAESYFSVKNDYPSALAEYEEVLKFKDSDLYGLALFKSAWCLWRLNRSDEAVTRFVKVFEVTDKKKGASLSERKQLDELEGEALKYLVEVFTEDEKNTATDMHRFLAKIGGDRFAVKIVRALADTFYDQAHYERGIEAYELLLKLDPTSRDAPQWVLSIAQGYDTLEDYPKLRATYDRLLTNYTGQGSWARTQSDPKLVAEVQERVRGLILQSALAAHGKAQRDKSSLAEFEAAASLYELYLSRFKDHPQAYDVHYNLADIQFHRTNKPSEAATNYLAAARSMPESVAAKEAGNKLRHDALYNALSALERLRVTELEQRKRGAPAPGEGETEKKFGEALDLYAQLYPNDPELPRLFFNQGKLYYDSGVYDGAVRIFGALIERFPRSPEALPAGQLILDSFNRSKNYENIETWARRLKKTPAFQNAEEQKKLDTLIVQSVFKQGEARMDAKDPAGAAKAYLRAAKEFPRDQRAAQACVNAELAAQKSGDRATLVEAARLVTGKEYRERTESPQGAWIAASTLQAMGLFAESAEFHEAIAQLSDKDHPHFVKFEHAKDAAFNAVVLRTTVGDHDRAIANGNRFLALYGSSPEADEVTFYMGRAHEGAGRGGQAIELYRRFIARTKHVDHKAQAYVQLALLQIKAGDNRGADESLKAAVAMGKRKGSLGADGRYASARARYMEGERVLAKFDEIQIQGDVKQLSSRLKQKAALLKQASAVFLDTVSMGVAEWSTASLYQIGRTYEAFARSLRDAPPPSTLSDQDKEAYQQQIDEFVVPIEERALDAYENGWKKAVELGIYNQWTAKMRESLGRLNGELYPPLKETGFDIRSQGTNPLPPLLDAPKRGVAAGPTKPGDPKAPKAPAGKGATK